MRVSKSLKGVSLSRPDVHAGFQGASAVYRDDWYDYGSNEPSVDGTTAALLMLSVLELQ